MFRPPPCSLLHGLTEVWAWHHFSLLLTRRQQRWLATPSHGRHTAARAALQCASWTQHAHPKPWSMKSTSTKRRRRHAIDSDEVGLSLTPYLSLFVSVLCVLLFPSSLGFSICVLRFNFPWALFIPSTLGVRHDGRTCVRGCRSNVHRLVTGHALADKTRRARHRPGHRACNRLENGDKKKGRHSKTHHPTRGCDGYVLMGMYVQL